MFLEISVVLSKLIFQGTSDLQIKKKQSYYVTWQEIGENNTKLQHVASI